MRVLRCNCGAAGFEFALVILPVLFFILVIMQTAFIVWVDNLLQTAVNTAARCGAVRSGTLPCTNTGNLTTDMNTTATSVFGPLSGATFSANACSAGNVGMTGTYVINFMFAVNVTVTARSCYPAIPA
jgi:hypothetical protein